MNVRASILVPDASVTQEANKNRNVLEIELLTTINRIQWRLCEEIIASLTRCRGWQKPEFILEIINWFGKIEHNVTWRIYEDY